MQQEKIEETLARARTFFSKDRYATETTGICIEKVEKGYAKCSLVLDERHKNATGQVMGGAIFTLADFTFAVATNFDQPVTVTAVSQISFLGTAKGNTLYGESALIKDGKRSCFYRIQITDDLGNPVAEVATNGMHL